MGDELTADATSAPPPSAPSCPTGTACEVACNVWERCTVWFLPRYYRTSPRVNPQGPTICNGRVMRGGSPLCRHSYCNRYRVAARSHNTPDSSSGTCGFRTIAPAPSGAEPLK